MKKTTARERQVINDELEEESKVQYRASFLGERGDIYTRNLNKEEYDTLEVDKEYRFDFCRV